MILFHQFMLLVLIFGAQFAHCSKGKRRLKILVYSPINAWSHMQFMGKIADTLAEAGHEVHFFKFINDPIIGARNETKLAHKNYRIVPEHLPLAHFSLDNWAPIREPFAGNGYPLLTVTDFNLGQILNVWVAYCKELLASSELLQRMTIEHYDVAISEAYDLCPFSVFHKIGVKTMLGASTVHALQWTVTHFGIPVFASFVPNDFSVPMEAPNLNFWGRLRNFYNFLYDWHRLNEYSSCIEEPLIARTFGANFPTQHQLARNISLFFANTNPLFVLPRPTSHKVIHIGGLVEAENGTLDEHIQSILDASDKGVVLVSFGSIADTRRMGTHMRRSLLNVFGRRFSRYDFIWKLDSESRGLDSARFELASNMHTFDWFPQSAILKHSKVRAFITHCGLNSLTESAEAGVPVVAIPLFADQAYNAAIAKHAEMGVYLDVGTLNGDGAEDLIGEALNKVLHSPIYGSNAKILAKKLALSPFRPSEVLTRWVEFAAEFPPLIELNLPSDEELSWFVYFSLDVVLSSAVVFVLATAVTVKAMLALSKHVHRQFEWPRWKDKLQ